MESNDKNCSPAPDRAYIPKGILLRRSFFSDTGMSYHDTHEVWSALLKLFILLDVCVSSLRRGHASLLCIAPILTDDLRRESEVFSQHIIRNIQYQIMQHIIRRESIASKPQNIQTIAHWSALLALGHAQVARGAQG